jgi:RNA polymerase sigma-70 factor (ECF subfamily)
MGSSVPRLRLVSSAPAPETKGPPASSSPASCPSSPSFARRPSLDDHELLEALRRSDPSAATALHDRVRPQVDRTILRLLGAHDADRADLAQLALIEIVRTIHRYRGECSLDGWTSTLTARVVYKEIRKRRTDRRILGALDGEDYVAQAPASTERGAVAKNLLARVREHLTKVEEAKAWTFLLHDACGYDLQEIAEITGVSVAAAQTRLVRGRREMHERIAADPELAAHIDAETGGVA